MRNKYLDVWYFVLFQLVIFNFIFIFRKSSESVFFGFKSTISLKYVSTVMLTEERTASYENVLGMNQNV